MTAAMSRHHRRRPIVVLEALLARRQQLGYRAELYIHRRGRVDKCAELELAAGRVDAEHSNIVGILVGGVEKGPRWIDVHAAGPLPAR